MSIVAQGAATRTGRSDYETPIEFVRRVETFYGTTFTLDVAATWYTAKAPAYIGPDHPVECMRDGLTVPWSTPTTPGTWCWLNPPYGQGVGVWCARADLATAHGLTVVGLLPGNAWGSRWWQRWVMMSAHEIVPISGRIKFLLDGSVQSSPANDNALVLWRPGMPPAVPTLREAFPAHVLEAPK